MDYQALIRTIVLSLVTKPEAVDVTTEDEGDFLRLLIHVAEEDTGRVIGRKGATINAIRQLARVAAAKGGDNVEVDVAETERPAE